MRLIERQLGDFFPVCEHQIVGHEDDGLRPGSRGGMGAESWISR